MKILDTEQLGWVLFGLLVFLLLIGFLVLGDKAYRQFEDGCHEQQGSVTSYSTNDVVSTITADGNVGTTIITRTTYNCVVNGVVVSTM